MRRTSGGMLILLTVTVDAGLSLRRAHDIAGALEASIRRSSPEVTDVVLHTEPADSSSPGTTP